MAQGTVNIYGTTKAAHEVSDNGTGDEQQAVFNSRGDLVNAQSLPERSELVRLGGSWGSQLTAAAAWTALITIPTTLANMSLQNGETVGTGKSYIIDRVWVKSVTSLAAANYLTILCQIVPPGTALVADSASKTTYSLSAKALTYDGEARIAVASTATGCLTDRWNHLASVSLPTSTTIAAVVESNVYGRYIIPPGGNFSINAQEAVSGGTLICGVEWHEVKLALGT